MIFFTKIKIRQIQFVLVVFLPSVACNVHADLPLSLENLITNQGKIKLDLSVSYVNFDQKGISTGEPILVQTGPVSFVSIPTAIGEHTGNSDSIIGTAGLRYGASSNAEIYVRASYLQTSHRSSGVTGVSNYQESRFADSWIGLNYKLKEDSETPALLVFAEVALSEKTRTDNASFKSTMLGLTGYRAIDPVVFSMTAAYRFNMVRDDGDDRDKPGNLLLLSPSVGFAVNDRVTLTTGMQWTSRQAARVGGQKQGYRRNSTDFLLGVGYGFSTENVMNVTFKSNASGRDGADLRVSWLHNF